MSTLTPTPVQLEVTAGDIAARPWFGGRVAVWLALTLVLAVGAFTHLTQLGLIEFKADEAQVAGLALSVAQGHWPAASIATSNGGLDNPPLPLYLFAIPALVTRDPAWQAAVSGLLDVAAMALVFLAGRRFFGERVGLAGSAFYAAAAYPAVFARKLAGPYLQPFFAALLLLALLAIAERRKPAAWLWAGAVLAFGALVQIHLGALLLAPVVALLVAVDAWKHRSWRPLIGAAGGGAVTAAGFAPYLAFEASHRAGFLASIGGYAQGSAAWTLDAFRFVWTTVSSPGYGDLTGGAAGVFNAETWPALYVAALTGVAVLGGLIVVAWRGREWLYLTLSLVVVGPLLLTLRHGPGLEIHYFAFLLPGLFLLAGIGFDALLRAAPWLRLPAFAVLGLLLAVQVAGFRHFTRFIEERALPDSYGTPLVYQERLFDEVLRIAAGRTVVAGVSGRDQAAAADYFLRGEVSVNSNPHEGLLLPAGGGAYASLSRATRAAHVLEAAVEPSYTEPLPGGGQAAAYRLAPDSLQAVAAGGGSATPSPAVWTNGVQLVGVAAPRSLPAQLASFWRVTARPDSSTLFFSQVVDDGGKQWFDRDSTPASASGWQQGDGLVLLTPVSLPPEAPRQEYWWTAGMYVDGGRRVALDNGATELRLARLKGGAAPAVRPDVASMSEVFGSIIRLDGYAIAPGAVTLQWSCVAPPGRDYTVFVHVLGPGGQVTAQADSQPERYPTSLWDPGETVVDRHALAVPPGATIEVGLYDLATGQRLRLANGADHVTLTQAAAR